MRNVQFVRMLKCLTKYEIYLYLIPTWFRREIDCHQNVSQCHVIFCFVTVAKFNPKLKIFLNRKRILKFLFCISLEPYSMET